MLLTEKEARAATEKMLSFVTADDAVVSVGSEIYSHLRFAANSFQTSGRRENVTASVTVWKDAGGAAGGRKRGTASSNSLDEASLREAVAEAERDKRDPLDDLGPAGGKHPRLLPPRPLRGAPPRPPPDRARVDPPRPRRP